MINLGWAVSGSSDRVYYSPNDDVNFILSMENYSTAYIKIAKINVIFDLLLLHAILLSLLHVDT
jgi:hypothetical protein